MSPDEMAFVAVTPDHIDVALHAAFALHAALRLLLLLVIRISSLIFFILFYFFYYILLYFNIYLLNEDEKTLVARVAPNLPIMWPALCPPPIPDVKVVPNNYLC